MLNLVHNLYTYISSSWGQFRAPAGGPDDTAQTGALSGTVLSDGVDSIRFFFFWFLSRLSSIFMNLFNFRYVHNSVNTRSAHFYLQNNCMLQKFRETNTNTLQLVLAQNATNANI